MAKGSQTALRSNPARHSATHRAATNALRSVGSSGGSHSVRSIRRTLGSAASNRVAAKKSLAFIPPGRAPGAPGGRPGGMSASDFFIATRMLAAEPKVCLIDLTEWDPPLDPTDLSALVAARWVAECLAGFEHRAV